MIHKKLDEKREICGIVIPERTHGVLKLDFRDFGPVVKDGERGSCRSTNSGLNFHTHPYIVWPWPSTEDMFNILYSRDQQKELWGSLIFTEWGIWEIYGPTKFSRNMLNKDKEWWNVNASDKLFFALGLDENALVPPLKEVLTPIREWMALWDEEFGESGLQITLTGWDKIKNNYYLQTNIQDKTL